MHFSPYIQVTFNFEGWKAMYVVEAKLGIIIDF